MTRSEQINELATALAKAQGEIEGATKTAENPHFRSKYADLASIRDAIQEPFAKHGLSYIQPCRLVSLGESAWMVEVETLIFHTSGQFIGETLGILLQRADAQGEGSAITYGRRYGLAAMAGVAPEDDDGNAAVGPSAQKGGRVERGTGRSEQRGQTTAKVLGVVIRPPADPSIKPIHDKYIVTCDDKQTYQTLVLAHAETAKEAQKAGIPVELKYRQESFGRVIESIAERDAQEPPL